MRVGEAACHAVVAHSADTHQRSSDLSDLERALDLPVPIAVTLKVQQQMAFVTKLLAVAHDEVLLPSTPIRLSRARHSPGLSLGP